MDVNQGMEVDYEENPSLIDPKVARNDVLELVLHHLNIDERKQAMETCKKFYEVLCRIEKRLWYMKLNRQVKHMLF